MSLALDVRLSKLFVVEGRNDVVPFMIRVKGVGALKTRSAYLVALDSSWSMDGSKIFFAKDSVLRMVKLLDPDDYISVYSFYGKVSKVLDIEKVGNTDKIVRAVADIKLGGGTNIYSVLEQMYADATRVREELKSRERDAVPSVKMVMVTDGNPTTGVRDGDRILDMAGKLGKHVSVSLVIGVGEDYNEKLLSGIALKTNGFFEHLDDPAKMPSLIEKMASAYRGLSAKNLRILIKTVPGVGVYIYNKPAYTSRGGVEIEVGDVYEGETITVVGELLVPPQKRGMSYLATVTGIYTQTDGAEKELPPTNVTIPCVHIAPPDAVEVDNTVFREVNLIRVASIITKDLYGQLSADKLMNVLENIANSTIVVENRELYTKTIDLKAQLEKEGLSPDVVKKVVALISRILSGRYE